MPAARLPLDGAGRRPRQLVGGHRTQSEAWSLEASGLHTSSKPLTLLNPGALTCWRRCRAPARRGVVRRSGNARGSQLSAWCQGKCIWLCPSPTCPLSRSAPPEPPAGSCEHGDAQMGSNGLEHPAYLIQAGDEAWGRTGEAKPLLDGGEAALEVGTI